MYVSNFRAHFGVLNFSL